MARVWLFSYLLPIMLYLVVGAQGELEPGTEVDWGSGLHELLHSFPADSPFVTETAGRPANCSQRFWLPPSSPVCWDDIVGPEEFEKSRLLVLQNRAALRAVAEASGVTEGGSSYTEQAKEDMQGIESDHLSIVQTAETMEKVFISLEEKRRDGTELWTFSSLKDRLSTTKDSIHGRQHLADLLETRLSHLEEVLQTLQLRLAELVAQ